MHINGGGGNALLSNLKICIFYKKASLNTYISILMVFNWICQKKESYIVQSCNKHAPYIKDQQNMTNRRKNNNTKWNLQCCKSGKEKNRLVNSTGALTRI